MLELRYPEPEDAERFYEILNRIDSRYYYAPIPDSVEKEREWIKSREEKRKNNQEYNYAIIYNDEIVGGCSITILQEYEHIGEIGYFVDQKYTNQGIATRVVKELENIAFNELGLVRLEIRMDPANKASEKVARKNGYRREGLLKKAIELEGDYYDCFLYAKVKVGFAPHQ